jgi:hypothetical protein
LTLPGKVPIVEALDYLTTVEGTPAERAKAEPSKKIKAEDEPELL